MAGKRRPTTHPVTTIGFVCMIGGFTLLFAIPKPIAGVMLIVIGIALAVLGMIASALGDIGRRDDD